MRQAQKYILGIDTSCDETSMALMGRDCKRVVANVISSQVKLHNAYGGVVPELASRSHLENISLVFTETLAQAAVSLADIDQIAVTTTPGLVGCLLVGVSFAQGLAYQLGVPLSGVNHLQAHLMSPFIHKTPAFPCLGLVVSGGHTAFYDIRSFDESPLLGQTVDDAAGEAFDKCAKMMGLSYPGGPLIDQLASSGNDQAFAFAKVRVKMGQEYLSFSGIKTAFRHHLESVGELTPSLQQDLSASLQKTIVSELCQKMEFFLDQKRFLAVAVSGGVALNRLLRRRVLEICQRRHISCFLTDPEFSTDNGAMIAFLALVKKLPNQLFSITTQASQKLQARRLYREKSYTRKTKKSFSQTPP